MDERVALYAKKLGISEEEARQMIADDDADVSGELSPEQEAVVKQMTQADRKKEDKPRTRKPDEDKRFLIRILETAIGYNPQVTNFEVTNPEREIQFEFRGALYRLTLAKPRKN